MRPDREVQVLYLFTRVAYYNIRREFSMVEKQSWNETDLLIPVSQRVGLSGKGTHGSRRVPTLGAVFLWVRSVQNLVLGGQSPPPLGSKLCCRLQRNDVGLQQEHK